jgi:hypothetical protein
MEKSITININNLIENFSVVGQTTESKETIKQVVTDALLTAINDVNLNGETPKNNQEPKVAFKIKVIEANSNNELNEKIIAELQKANRQNKKVAITKYCYAVISTS